MNSSYIIPSLDEFAVAGRSTSVLVCDSCTLKVNRRMPFSRTALTVCGCCSVSETQLAISMISPNDIRILDFSSTNSTDAVPQHRGVRGRFSEKCATIQELRGHHDSVYKITRIPVEKDFDETWGLVSGSADSTVRLWKCSSGKELAKLQCNNEIYSCLRYSNQSHRVYFGQRGGVVLGWNLNSLEKLELSAPSINSGSAGGRGVALDEENETIYADGPENVNVFSPLTSSNPVSSFPIPSSESWEYQGSITEMFFHAQSMSIFVYVEGGVHVIDSRRMGQPVRSFIALSQNSDCLAEISQIGERTFVSVNGSHDVSRWTLEGKIENTQTYHSPLYAIFSPYRSLMNQNDRSFEDEISRIDFFMGSHFVEVKIAVGHLILVAPTFCLRLPCRV